LPPAAVSPQTQIQASTPPAAYNPMPMIEESRQGMKLERPSSAGESATRPVSAKLCGFGTSLLMLCLYRESWPRDPGQSRNSSHPCHPTRGSHHRCMAEQRGQHRMKYCRDCPLNCGPCRLCG
jgi:hypothetical protein